MMWLVATRTTRIHFIIYWILKINLIYLTIIYPDEFGESIKIRRKTIRNSARSFPRSMQDFIRQLTEYPATSLWPQTRPRYIDFER